MADWRWQRRIWIFRYQQPLLDALDRIPFELGEAAFSSKHVLGPEGRAVLAAVWGGYWDGGLWVGGERGALCEGFGVAAFGVGEEPAGRDFDVVHFILFYLPFFGLFSFGLCSLVGDVKL